MSKDTWNFPCYQPMDWGTADAIRNVHGMVWEQGGVSGTTQPYSTGITALFSFFQRSGWSDESGQPHSVFSIGDNGATHSALAIYAYGVPLKLTVKFWDETGAAYRYQIDLGDEDGVNWLQVDKWYHVGIAADSSGISYVVNGTTSPKETVTTNTPGALSLNQGTDRLWIHHAQAAYGTNDPATITGFWPTLVMGPMALSTEVLDFSSSTVRDRIWDASGDFKNPGENGSLWFDSTYDAVVPYHYFLDGSPRRDNGSGTEAWRALSGGGSGSITAPGGLRKQYEAATAVSYAPSMMTFDGSTGYYKDTSVTVSGNKLTAVFRFNVAEFSGGSNKAILTVIDSSTFHNRIQIVVFSNDFGTAANRNKLRVLTQDTAAAGMAVLYSIDDLTDGQDHVGFYSLDADTGVATFVVDGVDADDTSHPGRVAPTTGTLPTGANIVATVGAVITPGNYFAGDIGFIGFSNSYLTNYADFMTLSVPKQIDEYSWTQWGSQPLVWADNGKLDTHNVGSSGGFTKFGTITGPS